MVSSTKNVVDGSTLYNAVANGQEQIEQTVRQLFSLQITVALIVIQVELTVQNVSKGLPEDIIPGDSSSTTLIIIIVCSVVGVLLLVVIIGGVVWYVKTRQSTYAVSGRSREFTIPTDVLDDAMNGKTFVVDIGPDKDAQDKMPDVVPLNTFGEGDDKSTYL